MSTHNLCFEQKYEKYQNFSSENFHFLVVKFPVYLNRHVFIMIRHFFFFNRKILIFFLFLHKNICCGYSLEAPH